MGKDYQEHGLYLHNWYRKRHGAPKLVLSDRLNQAADAYAYRLACRRMLQHTSGLDYVENLYGGAVGNDGKTKKQHVYAACEGWYKENKKYNYNRPGFSMQTGHFTAMVWKGMTQLGIGYGESNGFKVVCACYDNKTYLSGDKVWRANVLPYRKVADTDDEDEEEEKKVDTSKAKDDPTATKEIPIVTWTGLNWLPGEGGDVPDRSVRAGEVNGKSLFIVRAKHEGATIPGKLVSGSSKAIVGYGGIEHSKSDYQVLTLTTGGLTWVNSANGEILKHSVLGGQEATGDKYYIGRAKVASTLSVGKVHVAHKGCYVTNGGYEHFLQKDYDILVYDPEAKTEPESKEVLDKSKSEETGENVQEDAYETWDIPSQLKTKFLELADEKGTIDWEGLKVLLELDTDHQIQFDKITCVLMILHETSGGKGRINLDEFKRLMQNFVTMADCAAEFDKDDSKTLDPFELKEALEHSGFHVTFKTVQVLKELFCEGGDYMGPRAFFLCYTLLSMLQQFREKRKKAGDVFEDFSLKDWMKTQMEKAADY